ncbi:putative collagen alpha-1(XII) chain-like [Scophthalmus maximus]|nr:uncharacterized protein LOC118301634 isoform X1 [Scophthalmus maximus]XP_035483169.1 uncharacterized protein LOC118301634 isoform X1 [Scophthalmus maximus]XP_035483170.1 uncharacterized protein LOC118301634 isoform X2 [Scophthalmus maximus]AWP00808.1 putative collagen alpha-1(XII) chain-like [Scophthalmus maximus]
MLRNVALLVFGRLLLAVDSRAGQVLPPQNMSLLWMNDFEPEVTWAPPQHSVANCTYQVFKKTTKRDNDYDLPSPPWKSVVVMEGGFLQVSVKTVCGGKRSEPTVLNVTYPEMVKNVQCYILSSKHAHCSWESANPTAVVHFFYRLVEENLSTSVHDDSPSPRLRECPMSNYKERAGTGCVLQVTLKQGILIVFNGTVNKVPFRNTFRRMPLDHVKPPPLNWTVIKTGKRFLISWIPPDIKPLFGKYIINYTECDKIKIKTIANVEETSAELALLPHCQYRIAMKAQYETFSTPWGDEEHFDADKDSNSWVYVIIPLMVAALATLTFVCCRKNKNHIFPKLPQPRDLLSDISENNNKSAVCNLYIPTEDDVGCKIMLVTEPNINTPDC